FTGAVRDRSGRFELAGGGTIFLDEIGDMPLHLQVKLLRVLQEKTFERVGDSHTRTTDARVIAATNKDLQQAVLSGEFREDLYYRLRVVPISIPPLRERREDIEPLVRHLSSRNSPLRTACCRSLLVAAITRASVVRVWLSPTRSKVFSCTRPTAGEASMRGTPGSPETSLQTRDSEYERIRATLDQHHWHRADAAKALGVSRTTLWRKMRELGLLR
ncbi:MAG: sigma 54-interacting transcriptional regulator, partial [Acidobacteriota bacterium]